MLSFLVMIGSVIAGRIAHQHHNEVAVAFFGVTCVGSALYLCRRWILGK